MDKINKLISYKQINNINKIIINIYAGYDINLTGLQGTVTWICCSTLDHWLYQCNWS